LARTRRRGFSAPLARPRQGRRGLDVLAEAKSRSKVRKKRSFFRRSTLTVLPLATPLLALWAGVGRRGPTVLRSPEGTKNVATPRERSEVEAETQENVSPAEGYGEVDQEKAKLFPPKSFGFTSKPLASLEGLLWPGRAAVASPRLWRARGKDVEARQRCVAPGRRGPT